MKKPSLHDEAAAHAAGVTASMLPQALATKIVAWICGTGFITRQHFPVTFISYVHPKARRRNIAVVEQVIAPRHRQIAIGSGVHNGHQLVFLLCNGYQVNVAPGRVAFTKTVNITSAADLFVVQDLFNLGSAIAYTWAEGTGMIALNICEEPQDLQPSAITSAITSAMEAKQS